MSRIGGVMRQFRRGVAGAAGPSAGVSVQGRKRFYKDVGVVAQDGGYMINLDGKTLRTPHRNSLVLPSSALAHAIAFEWESQHSRIQPSAMPMMTLACTAIDIAEERREGTVTELMRFLDTDTVLFPDDPREAEKGLVTRQRLHWTPLVNWMRENFGDLNVGTEMVVQPHPTETKEAVRSELESLDAFRLTAVESLAAGCKSIIIPLALHRRQITVLEALEAARVEEEHQVKQWGLVEGNHDVDRLHLTAQVSAASLFLWLAE